MNDTTNYMEYKLMGNTHIYIKKNADSDNSEKLKTKNTSYPKKIRNLEIILSSITSKAQKSTNIEKESFSKCDGEEKEQDEKGSSPLFKIFKKAPSILKNPIISKKGKRIAIKRPQLEENLLKSLLIQEESQVKHEDNLLCSTEETCSNPEYADDPRQHHYFCEKCYRIFDTMSAFSEHQKLHIEKKSIECEECHKKFTLKNNLKKHIRIVHKKERHFKCETCSKTFGLKFDLQKHIRTHTGERPYTCPHCLSKFGRKEVLISHIRTHTGEKPFSCHVCSSKFTQKISLVRHLRIHSEPYSCPQCPLKFAQKKSLNNHLNIHSLDQKIPSS